MAHKQAGCIKTAEVLAAELGSLRLARRKIEARIEEVRSRLYEQVGDGWEFESDLVRVKVSAPSVSCRVVSRDALPSEFKSLQPDKRLIMKSLKATGVLVPGTELTQVWNNIKVDLAGNPLGIRFDSDGVYVASREAAPPADS